MKTIQEIKTDIDVLVRKQGNQGALKLGDVLDDVVDIVQNVNNTLDKLKAQIPDVATFHTTVPSTATEIIFAYYGGVDLTGYTKSGSIGKDIDVYSDGTKYAVLSGKTIFAPENSAEFFKNYTALTSLDLSNFDTSNVSSFARMFAGCAALTSLDLANFNTTNVTTMNSMFAYCAALTSLDLADFNTANVTIFASMFRKCTALVTLIANDWSASVTSANMFNGCTSLVGGNGTTYDRDHTDASYAHIDVADNPGYFTAPA